MSLTRKALKAMGIEEEKIDQIIEEHTSTLEEIKSERDELRNKVKSLDTIQKQLDDANELLKSKDSGESEYKAKYEELQNEFTTYKTSIENEKTYNNKEAKFLGVLKESLGIVDDKSLTTIVHASKDKINGIELTDDGNIKDSDSLMEYVKSDFPAFIPQVSEQGAKTAQPPFTNGSGTTMTKEQISAIKDPVARQKAMKENINLYIK